jgi:hypothetical protein
MLKKIRPKRILMLSFGLILVGGLLLLAVPTMAKSSNGINTKSTPVKVVKAVKDYLTNITVPSAPATVTTPTQTQESQTTNGNKSSFLKTISSALKKLPSAKGAPIQILATSQTFHDWCETTSTAQHMTQGSIYNGWQCYDGTKLKFKYTNLTKTAQYTVKIDTDNSMGRIHKVTTDDGKTIVGSTTSRIIGPFNIPISAYSGDGEVTIQIEPASGSQDNAAIRDIWIYQPTFYDVCESTAKAPHMTQGQIYNSWQCFDNNTLKFRYTGLTSTKQYQVEIDLDNGMNRKHKITTDDGYTIQTDTTANILGPLDIPKASYKDGNVTIQIQQGSGSGDNAAIRKIWIYDMTPPKLRIAVIGVRWGTWNQNTFHTRAKSQFDNFVDQYPCRNCKDNVQFVEIPYNCANLTKSNNGCVSLCSNDNVENTTIESCARTRGYVKGTDYDYLVGLNDCAWCAGYSQSCDVVYVEQPTDNDQFGRNVTAHELGHEYGLEDEYCCQDGTSQAKWFDRCLSTQMAPHMNQGNIYNSWQCYDGTEIIFHYTGMRQDAAAHYHVRIHFDNSMNRNHTVWADNGDAGHVLATDSTAEYLNEIDIPYNTYSNDGIVNIRIRPGTNSGDNAAIREIWVYDQNDRVSHCTADDRCNDAALYINTANPDVNQLRSEDGCSLNSWPNNCCGVNAGYANCTTYSRCCLGNQNRNDSSGHCIMSLSDPPYGFCYEDYNYLENGGAVARSGKTCGNTCNNINCDTCKAIDPTDESAVATCVTRSDYSSCTNETKPICKWVPGCVAKPEIPFAMHHCQTEVTQEEGTCNADIWCQWEQEPPPLDANWTPRKVISVDFTIGPAPDQFNLIKAEIKTQATQSVFLPSESSEYKIELLNSSGSPISGGNFSTRGLDILERPETPQETIPPNDIKEINARMEYPYETDPDHLPAYLRVTHNSVPIYNEPIYAFNNFCNNNGICEPGYYETGMSCDDCASATGDGWCDKLSRIVTTTALPMPLTTVLLFLILIKEILMKIKSEICVIIVLLLIIMINMTLIMMVLAMLAIRMQIMTGYLISKIIALLEPVIPNPKGLMISPSSLIYPFKIIQLFNNI